MQPFIISEEDKLDDLTRHCPPPRRSKKALTSGLNLTVAVYCLCRADLCPEFRVNYAKLPLYILNVLNGSGCRKT